MKNNQKILKKISAVYFRFKPIVIFYILFVAFWIILYFYRIQLTTSIDNNIGAGFFLSYFASLSEDIIFFGIIGFVALVLSTKLPEDEEFSIRIRSLANSDNVGLSAKNYLESQIKKILAYHSETIIKVVIKDYDSKTNSIKVYTEITNTIMNMCKDISYPLIETEALVEPDSSVNGNYGYISYLGVYDEREVSNRTILIDGDIHELDQNTFRQEIPFVISENSTANWRLCFCIWQKLGADRKVDQNWYFSQVERYTESLVVELHNELDSDNLIVYDYSYLDRGKSPCERISEKGLQIAGKDKKKLVNNFQFYPMDRFEIYFSEHKNKEDE
ncbi:MAG: hypothetical protein H7246_05420 [Phycisphaerae bacterium]|nr:hypothetical protein [Saprospiraceae bacterium]